MIAKDFCQSGMNEDVKGGIHAATALLLGTMTLYNGFAWWNRREAHLSRNALLYGVLTGLELYQAFRHWGTHP